jgi:hypothetical protein
MAEGMALVEVAAAIGISYQSLINWQARYPDFLDAINEGADLAKAWWMARGRLNIFNPNFNSTLWMMNMSNRYGWTRKVEGNMHMLVAGGIDHNHRHVHTKIDLDQLDYEEVLNLRDIIQRAAIRTAPDTGAG